MSRSYEAILCAQLVTLYVFKPVLSFSWCRKHRGSPEVAKAAIVNHGCLLVESLVSAIACML